MLPSNALSSAPSDAANLQKIEELDRNTQQTPLQPRCTAMDLSTSPSGALHRSIIDIEPATVASSTETVFFSSQDRGGFILEIVLMCKHTSRFGNGNLDILWAISLILITLHSFEMELSMYSIAEGDSRCRRECNDQSKSIRSTHLPQHVV